MDMEAKINATSNILEATDKEERGAVLKGYLFDWEQKEDYGFDKLIDKISRFWKTPVTQEMGGVVVERCSNKGIEQFLRMKGYVQITDQLVQTVERNPRADKEALLLLLAKMRDSK